MVDGKFYADIGATDLLFSAASIRRFSMFVGQLGELHHCFET
jgi:hypothetical protein